MLKRYGKRTPEYLDQIGYLDDLATAPAVHLTEASEEEAARSPTAGLRWSLLRQHRHY